jgi:hypothetical protein
MNLHMKMAVAVANLAGAALLLPGLASGTPTPLTIPVFPGVAALPGIAAPAATPAANMTSLTTKPDVAVAGTKFTLSGTGLPANADVMLTWGTANVTWVVDARPDSVDYLGRSATKLNVILGSAKTDSSGAFKASFVAPRDFGGIHDIYAVVDGKQVAKGGFLVARSATITPKRGPIGTMITVRYNGLGSSLYEGGGSLLYDNKYTGAIMANWTRGTAIMHIRAAGPVGVHTIEVADAISFKYLNIQQSPIPWGTGKVMRFTVTKDNGRPKPRMDWPAQVAPTLDAKTTLQLSALSTKSSAIAQLSSTSGAVNTSVGITGSGLAANAPVDLEWSTVVGNRVNCTGTCWTFVSVPLGTPTTDANGAFSSRINIPDGLGGWHVVQMLQNGVIKAQTPYYVKRSIVGNGVSSLVLHDGQRFTVHLKGLGWTQLDNTIAVDYDNSYVGYGCGFNSQGDTVMNLVATGRPGTHLIDMYPLLYTQQPSYANTPYGMIPVLTYAQDAPGLALGYDLPAIRLAITVVK